MGSRGGRPLVGVRICICALRKFIGMQLQLHGDRLGGAAVAGNFWRGGLAGELGGTGAQMANQKKATVLPR